MELRDRYVPGCCQLDRQWQIFDELLQFFPEVLYVLVAMAIIEVGEPIHLFLAVPPVSERCSATLTCDVDVFLAVSVFDFEFALPMGGGL